MPNIRRRKKREKRDLETPPVKPVKKGRLEDFFTERSDKKNSTNAYMLYTMIPVLIIFACLIGYIVKFTAIDSRSILTSPYNKRTSSIQQKVRRGKIISANDKILAETVTSSDGEDTRSYPYEDIFAHVVGYSKHGKGGLESAYNYDLITSHTNILDQIQNSIESGKTEGDSIVTSLDTRLQKAAYEALGDYRGAIVAIEPKTGKVRAMVSKPDFDPNTLDENWDEISADNENGPLMNRVLQGLYPPGSTYKVLTALEYIKEHPDDYNDFSYYCEGETIVNSVHISCYHDQQHGEENLEQAFAKSCNTAFVTLGASLNQKKFVELNEKALFNTTIDFDISVKNSRFKLTASSDKSDVPQTVIGQGNTQMTPFHNALIMCAVANDGVLMKPTLVDKIVNADGDTVSETKTKEYKTLMNESEAKILQGMLENVVTDGTASALQTDLYTAAGKTGTAENEKSEAHSWFVGYSNVDDPDLVVCVIVENMGAGSEYAAPIAREVFDSYYNNALNEEYAQ